jgi:hypothetical protein
VLLAPRATLVELPAGTFAAAEALRAGLDARRPARTGSTRADALEPRADALETVLVLPRPTPSRHALDDVHAERLEPGVAALLDRARAPLDAAARARFAREQGAEPDALERFVAELSAEGWLVRGPSPRP